VKHDAIVVGGGPAGLVAARAIARKGFRVAVLERERHLGVKPCGEAVSKETLEDASVTPAGDFVAQEIKGALVYAPNGKSVSIKGESGAGCILNKALFLQHLASGAVEAGADILMNRAVVDLDRRDGLVKVKTRGGELETSLVLGADGFASTVAERFGFEKTGSRELIPCIQYLMVNCNLNDQQVTEFYLGREVAPLGYAWIFPKGGGKANVGIGVRGSPAKPYLDRFIRGHPEIFAKARIVGIEGAPVTIGGMLERIVGDNVMLVGEAASQVIPLTGAGIHSGIAGGRMAAQTAVEALEEEDLSRGRLMSYPRAFDEHWGKRIRDSLKALRVMERLSDGDLNQLADLLDSKDVLDLANGFDVARVARKFLRHPLFGLRIAKALTAT